MYNIIGKTLSGYTILVIPFGVNSPMKNHKGGEIAVDDDNKIMYAWEIFVIIYGTESIIKACESYRRIYNE